MNKYGIIGLIILIAIVIGGAAYYMSIQQTKTVVPTTTTTFTSTSPVASTTTTTSGLTSIEIEAIKYMAEEEKLAPRCIFETCRNVSQRASVCEHSEK